MFMYEDPRILNAIFYLPYLPCIHTIYSIMAFIACRKQDIKNKDKSTTIHHQTFFIIYSIITSFFAWGMYVFALT